jgi:hypothetical protein
VQHLWAGLLSLLVNSRDQVEYDDCDAYLQVKDNREMVYDCISSSFDGIIAMIVQKTAGSPSGSQSVTLSQVCMSCQ